MPAFLFAALAAATPLVADPGLPAPRSADPACAPAALQRAGVAPARLKRLDELPPAQQHLTVIRVIGGCQVATVKLDGAIYYVPVGPVGRTDLRPRSGPAPAPQAR